MDWKENERGYDDEVIGKSTIPELFENSVERFSDRGAQMYKGGVYDRTLTPEVLPKANPGAFYTRTYSETREVVRRLTVGFRELGVKHGDRVGIFSNTRMEWALSDFGILGAGGVVVTVYTSSSPEQVEYLLGNSGSKGVVVENQDLLAKVAEVEDDLEDLGFVVVMDRFEDPGLDADVYGLHDVYRIGAEAYHEDEYLELIKAGNPEDLASLVYTSGTTGQPKGVKLTHWNFRFNLNQLRKRFGPRPDKPSDSLTVDDEIRIVSFLPLAHVFERIGGHFGSFSAGGTVAYAESPETLREDFKKVKPTGGTSVPRVYEKIYQALTERTSDSVLKKEIFDWAKEVGLDEVNDEPDTFHSVEYKLADRLTFSKVREELGGKIQGFVSGGGSLDDKLCKLYFAMGIPMYEGYGMTEAAGPVSINPVEEPKAGTMGPPLPDVEVELDESQASSRAEEQADGRVGELLVKGDNVFDGYWKKPEKTREVFTGDGWFKTGDIVEITDDGYLVFHERAKQILVLSTGENVAPQPIEDRFTTSAVVDQICVIGDQQKFVSALIVPDFSYIRDRAEDEGIDLPEGNGELCDTVYARERVGEEVERVNQNLYDFDTIKEFRLLPENFSEENDLLTPTLKMKRRNIKDRFSDEIDSIYE
ncbi:MAG: long-chain fatty acid--CoA ligase [Halobacteria archaeon]